MGRPAGDGPGGTPGSVMSRGAWSEDLHPAVTSGGESEDRVSAVIHHQPAVLVFTVTRLSINCDSDSDEMYYYKL